MKQDIERNAWLIGPGIILGIGFGLFVNGYWLIDKFPAESKQLLLIIIIASLLASTRLFPAAAMGTNKLCRAFPIAAICADRLEHSYWRRCVFWGHGGMALLNTIYHPASAVTQPPDFRACNGSAW